MLEIVDGLTEQYVLRKIKLFESENIIDMALLLNVGHINNLENIEKKITCDETINVKEKIEKLKEKLKQHNNVRIWFSSIDSEDYNFFHFIVYLINKINKNIKINIIDVGTIKPIRKIVPTWSVSCYDTEEIKELLQFTRVLTQEEISNISDEWKMLEQENSDLRIIENKKLKSVSYDFLDKRILEELSKNKEMDEIKLVSDMMCRERNNNDVGGIYGCLIIKYRIKELIKQNKIKIVRERLIMNAIKELEKRTVIKIVKN